MIGISEEQFNKLGNNEAERKQNFGEYVYIKVTEAKYSPEEAGKITGILIDQEPSALIEMVGTFESLNEKIKEAHNLVKENSGAQ